MSEGKEFLRQLPLFAGLPEADLDWLYRMAEPVSFPAGQYVMEEGEPGDALYVVLDGEVQVTKRSGTHDVVLAVRGAGEVLGEMALLEQTPRTASVRVLRDSHLLRINQTAFQRMLSCSPAAPMAMLHTVMARLRSTELMVQQHQKMAALGTLAAGLAHELNNPAAAVRRGAAQLGDMLAEWERRAVELSGLALEPRQTERVSALREEVPKRAATPASLDPLARSDSESAVEMWLEDRGIDEAWELAPTLVAFGWDEQALDTLAQDFSEAQLPVVVRWLGTGFSVYALLHEVRTSAEGISEIVKAVKTYSYLDQAPIQEVDVHASLENTLVILRHKIKTGVSITRDYAPDLPHIEAYGSELNQVWTNIIDNAIDAMHGRGQLGLRTYTQDGRIVVEISDDGPGIPPEIQPRIFEPFFTTKEPGVGTGLGLHISYKIIEKHHGDIQVTSRPGATCFQVTLPIQFTGGEPAA
ncbi:MAG: ATP-binding protein [Chloroflexota bacterium]|nr:ATP-binding protein [Chloroflexota bacterium]